MDETPPPNNVVDIKRYQNHVKSLLHALKSQPFLVTIVEEDKLVIYIKDISYEDLDNIRTMFVDIDDDEFVVR